MSEPITQLLDQPRAFPEEGEWFVVHVQSRQERPVALQLMDQQVPFFLPFYRQVRIYRSRKKTINQPMIPGYIFVRGDLDMAYRADRTGRVARVIRVKHQGRLDWELRNLHRAIEMDAPIGPAQFLKEGIPVEVKAGPFKGLQGLVEKIHNPDRLILQVDMLGRAMSVEIDSTLLVPID